MDKLFIEGITLTTVIGTHAWERKLTQTLLIDLTIAINCQSIAKEDNLSDTVNYQSIAEKVVEFGQKSKYQLIETFAQKLSEYLQQQFPISWLKVKIYKPGAVQGVKTIAVEIERRVEAD